jgi:hypothetical protein
MQGSMESAAIICHGSHHQAKLLDHLRAIPMDQSKRSKLERSEVALPACYQGLKKVRE